jgi:four helix bundle protein
MSTQPNLHFTDLEVWKKARQLKNETFELVKSFPPEEKYRLSDQLIRASRSVSDNIAEGHGRFTYKDQLHFCIQARGSLSETHNHLIHALDCKYINDEQLTVYVLLIKDAQKLLNGYISFLRKKIQNDNR